MTTAIIISVCVLLLIAYLFDLTSAYTRVPSVILLLLLGWGVKQVTTLFAIPLPDFTPFLPLLGTIGLILIVLEGSLELEINKSKSGLVAKSFIGALLPMLALAFLLAWAFQYLGQYSFKDSLLNAIPLCVISSSIAIPSARHLSSLHREFTTYESSLSDIMGVLFFNFVALNEFFDIASFANFTLQILFIIAISFVSIIGLSFLLSRIEHPIKFFPIVLLVILIYTVSKEYHLPALLFILLFGMILGNIDELKHYKWIDFFRPDKLDKEVKKFKELVIEATFLVRALFFLLFGYLIETAEILNPETFLWSLGIVAAIFAIRIVQLKLSGLPLRPLLFLAPRGLINILLFLSIDTMRRISIVNNSLITQVIIFTALVLMLGLMASPKNNEVKTNGND